MDTFAAAYGERGASAADVVTPPPFCESLAALGRPAPAEQGAADAADGGAAGVLGGALATQIGLQIGSSLLASAWRLSSAPVWRLARRPSPLHTLAAAAARRLRGSSMVEALFGQVAAPALASDCVNISRHWLMHSQMYTNAQTH